MRILIVDDDEVTREVIELMLGKDGHESVQACNGEEALNVYRGGGFDVMLLDIIMPVKDGFDTLIELFAEFPDAKVMAMTAGGKLKNFDYLEEAQKMGAFGSLRKPFGAEALRKMLARLASD